MTGGIVSKSAARWEAASEEVGGLTRGREFPVLPRKTSQRGAQLKHRSTLKISVGSTLSAHSPFIDKTGACEASLGKWLMASGSSFSGVVKPQARISVPAR